MDHLLPAAALVLGLFLAGFLAYLLAWRPMWYRESWQKELLARRLAYAIAHDVLHWAFDYSHIKTVIDNGSRRDEVQTVRFLTPLGRRVTLASDENGNDFADSYIFVWDSSAFDLRPCPVASVYLELDLAHLPYDHSLDWLLSHAETIELQAAARLLDSGVKRVKLQHVWLQDRDQRRVIFRVVFREREKGPAIPQQISYEDTIAAWAAYEVNRQKYNRLERLEREQLAARLLDCGIREYDGTFPLKKLQAAFAGEISHRQIEALGQRLETYGILEPAGGPLPRKINLERAREFITAPKVN